MIEVFNLLHGMDKLDAGENFLKLEAGTHLNRTEGHALKLQKPRYRTVKKNKFSHQESSNTGTSYPSW